jgi:hypothetical protein
MLIGIQQSPEGQDRLVQVDFELPSETSDEVKAHCSFSLEDCSVIVKIIQNKDTSHAFMQTGDGDVYQLLLSSRMCSISLPAHHTRRPSFLAAHCVHPFRHSMRAHGRDDDERSGNRCGPRPSS